MKRAILILLAACHTFQDPNVVVDLRVLAMNSTVPEQVIDVDLANPPPATELLAQLVPSTVCALVADPNFDGRRLRWSLTLCPPSGNDRCADDHPHTVLASGLADDPDLAEPEPQLCATIEPDGNLLGVILDALNDDALRGFQGEQYQVMLRVGGEDADPDLDQYAAKSLQVAARIPPERTANTNPYLYGIETQVGTAQAETLEIGRCVDQLQPVHVMAGAEVTMTPMEPDGVRETYVIPTLDGNTETFTETLSYQWTAGNGSFTKGTTGGPHDPFGNPAPLFTTWKAPKPDELNGKPDISIWLVQRDERLGVHWYESCIHVDVP